MTKSEKQFMSDMPHAAQVAWGLSTQSIDNGTKMNSLKLASAAVALADEHGLEAVTIRAVAKKVGLTTMGVYRHFLSRDELLLSMFELAMGRPLAMQPTTWQAAVRQWSNDLLLCYTEHAWLLDIPLTGIPLTPNHIAWVEQVLTALSTTNLPVQRQLDCALLIDGRARQFAQIKTGQSNSNADLNISAILVLMENSAPHLTAALRQGILQSKSGPNFTAGIDIVIHGIEAELLASTAK